MEKQIVDLLNELSVPAGNKGFKYLITAVTETVKNEGEIDNMTKPDGMYDRIARQYKSTPQRVERAIRHAIGTSFALADDMVLHKHFGPNISKQTNKNFIAVLSYEIIMASPRKVS